MEPTELYGHVFVYGTLRRGGANDINRLKPAPRFKGSARVAGRLFSLGDYPGIQLGTGGWVVGEVYALSPELEMILDDIEGITPVSDGQYQKEGIEVWVGSQNVYCLIYVATIGALAHGKRMASGDWMASSD